ncbi:hypothetical protein AAY473_008908 [Plecturocebus cupreus]
MFSQLARCRGSRLSQHFRRPRRADHETVSLCHPGWSAVGLAQATATSASWFQEILLPQPPHSWDYKCALAHRLIFVFLVEMGFHHVGQAGLKLLTSSNPPSPTSQSSRITGDLMAHDCRACTGEGTGQEACGSSGTRAILLPAASENFLGKLPFHPSPHTPTVIISISSINS